MSGPAFEASTARGGVRVGLTDDVRTVTYKTPSRAQDGWTHAIALCLPLERAAMSRRTVVSERGPDRAAIRPEDREAILFDLGLGTVPVDVCVRTSYAALLRVLSAAEGEPHDGAIDAILAASPHRVFLTRIGRGEVYQPIPPPDGKSPDGPHTHVLPKLLKSGRTHATTTPIPEGLAAPIQLDTSNNRVFN